MRGSQKGNEEQLLPQKWPQALGEPGEEQSCWDKGSSQETPQSGMNLLLGTVLLFLLLPGEWHPWHWGWCMGFVGRFPMGRCFSLPLRAPAGVTEQTHLGRAEFVPGARLVGSERRYDLAATTSHCSLLQGPSRLNATEKGKAGKIHLPRGIFRSLTSQTVRLALPTGQVLNNTVVGITVGESSISGLQQPVQITFSHGELPQVSQRCRAALPSPPGVTPRCVFWDASKGAAGGWRSSGCDTQPGDKGTVCSCDHLTFFTLLLSPALEGSTARALMAVATAGCGVAMAFSVFTMAFCIFVRWDEPAAPRGLVRLGEA
uniref:GAIN-B domain-containing protein n=1 Tax=Junco hyemalis TaxID=40217 RepID=A0A8C5IIN1_JUNHY